MDSFLLKKLVSKLVHFIPGLLVLMLLALLFVKRFPRTCHSIIFLSVCVLLAASSPPVSDTLVSYLENQNPVVQTIPVDTHSILILGSGHTWALDRPPNSVLSATALSRVTEGIRLWKKSPDTMLVTAGPKLYSVIAHADVAANMALASGVSADKVVRFTDTMDTVQEIERLANYVNENPNGGKTRVVIVSSATHLPRAALMMSQFDIPYTLAPADFIYMGSPWYRFSSQSIYNADRAIHEFIGMLWHWLAPT
ncbi:MAG: uncharacterized SAM-binding protein YcdF (DUF218 family) [Granulosicoccus sp.]|jgi:uncharacterized SAM-binding protein YcdF (DUF218 family)